METLAPPKSIHEHDQWFGNQAGKPSEPQIAEVNEYADQPMFIHPAEKPQKHNPDFRVNMFDNL